MASKGWTRVAAEMQEVYPREIMDARDQWVMCQCGERLDFDPLYPGDFLLMPCGHGFLVYRDNNYVLMQDVPEEAA